MSLDALFDALLACCSKSVLLGAYHPYQLATPGHHLFQFLRIREGQRPRLYGLTIMGYYLGINSISLSQSTFSLGKVPNLARINGGSLNASLKQGRPKRNLQAPSSFEDNELSFHCLKHSNCSLNTARIVIKAPSLVRVEDSYIQAVLRYVHTYILLFFVHLLSFRPSLLIRARLFKRHQTTVRAYLDRHGDQARKRPSYDPGAYGLPCLLYYFNLNLRYKELR
jgi:hypothetical protein